MPIDRLMKLLRALAPARRRHRLRTLGADRVLVWSKDRPDVLIEVDVSDRGHPIVVGPYVT